MWHPLCPGKLLVVIYLVLGIVFTIFGVLFVQAVERVVEYSIDYTDACCVANCSGSGLRRDANPCTVNLTLESTLKPPVMVYYELTNMYQNHKLYVRSRDDAQLAGHTRLPSDLYCNSDPNLAVEGVSQDSFLLVYKVDAANDTLDNVISPCGLIAKSLFNDSFTIVNASGSPVPLDASSVAWRSDRERAFSNAADGSTGNNFAPFAHWKQARCSDERLSGSQQEACVAARGAALSIAGGDNSSAQDPGWFFQGSGYCVEDERFIVWMRTAGLKDFRRKYAKIDVELGAGQYELHISNGVLREGLYTRPAVGQRPEHWAEQEALYPVHEWGGKKRLVLTTLSSFNTGKNPTLGYVFLVVGVSLIVAAGAFFIKMTSSPRKPGLRPRGGRKSA